MAWCGLVWLLLSIQNTEMIIWVLRHGPAGGEAQTTSLIYDNLNLLALYIQGACFSRDTCTEFTFFRGKRRKCVLYRGCDQRRRACSGPSCFYTHTAR